MQQRLQRASVSKEASLAMTSVQPGLLSSCRMSRTSEIVEEEGHHIHHCGLVVALVHLGGSPRTLLAPRLPS